MIDLVNITKNEIHYNETYSHIALTMIVNKVNNYQSFLDDAIQTDTSWHGLYYGNFKNCLAGKKVLELGCGDGLNAFIMAKLGAEVFAIDISEQSKRIIETVNRDLRLSVIALSGDFLDIKFDNQSFDFIVGKAFLHHLTHEQERNYLESSARLLKPTGEARFFEPAINNRFLDSLRWITPVPGRPSKLNKKEFEIWKENDPHPERDNGTKHFIEIGNCYFNHVETVMIGSIERLCRIIPTGNFNRKFRRWAHRIEPRLPNWFRYSAARSQLIIYRNPK